MEIAVHNLEGKVLRKVELDPAIFGVEISDHVLHSVVKAYRANRRQGTHATKTRAFVSGGGKKPWKQKGTGGARAGSTRSPLFPGGAKCHGPQPRDYREKLNKKLRALALKMALADRLQNQKLICVEGFQVDTYSTKQVKGVLKGFSLGKTLLSDERNDDKLYRSARNIYGVDAKTPLELNAEDVLAHESLLISEAGLKSLSLRLKGE